MRFKHQLLQQLVIGHIPDDVGISRDVSSSSTQDWAASTPKDACRGQFSLHWGEAEGLAPALVLVQLFWGTMKIARKPQQKKYEWNSPQCGVIADLDAFGVRMQMARAHERVELAG